MDDKPISPSVAEMLADRHQQIVDQNPELQPKPKGKNLFFISIIFLIIGLIGIGFSIYSFYRVRDVETLLKVKEIELQRLQETEEVKGVSVVITPTNTPTRTPLTTTPSIDPNKIPVGYVPKQTLCYTLYIPRENTADDEKNCELIFEASIAEATSLGVTIQTEYAKHASLDEMVKAAMTTLANTHEPVENVKVGNLDGRKLTELLADGTKVIHIYVFVPDKYQVGGLLASGFEITKSLDPNLEQKQQEVLHTILATWKWK